MCQLHSKKIEINVPIKCYKVLVKNPKFFLEGEKKFLSPYYDREQWEEGEKHSIYNSKSPLSMFLPSLVDSEGKINGGAYHSFKNYVDAEDFADKLHYFTDTPYANMVIAECIIPPDTDYVYEGESFSSVAELVPSYASHDIILKEIIKVCA